MFKNNFYSIIIHKINLMKITDNIVIIIKIIHFYLKKEKINIIRGWPTVT